MGVRVKACINTQNTVCAGQMLGVGCWTGSLTALMDPVFSTQSSAVQYNLTVGHHVIHGSPGVCSEDYSKHTGLHHSLGVHGLNATCADMRFLQDILELMTHRNVYSKHNEKTSKIYCQDFRNIVNPKIITRYNF